MTPEEQRIAIAESVGWREIKREDNRFIGHSTPKSTLWGVNPKGNRWDVPDYLNDLNAMHEVEKSLNDPKQYYAYHDWIWSITRTCAGYGIHATAAQRAEAYLKTIGQWKDDV